LPLLRAVPEPLQVIVGYVAAGMTRNAPAIMTGPKGICCFLVARPESSSAML
jgi:hypothetical protein